MNVNALKGAVISGINARRRTIIDSEIREDEFTAIAEVALNDMFGFSRLLRGATQGKGEFSTRYKVLSPPLLCRIQKRHTDLGGGESHASVAERAGRAAGGISQSRPQVSSTRQRKVD
jgi:hypothetical protein